MTMQQDAPTNFANTALRRSRSTPTLRLRHLMDAQQRIEIGNRIRDLRNASPQTNRSIADYVGVKERAVANWIGGSTGITYEHCKTVAQLFNVDHNWLWSGEERGQAPDLMAGLSADDSERLKRVERKLDELLRRTDREDRPTRQDPDTPPSDLPADDPIPGEKPPPPSDGRGEEDSPGEATG